VTIMDVFSISIQNDGKIIIGGDFSNTSINKIARLNTDGTLDAAFNPGTGPDAIVYSTSIQSDGKIIIGGAFTNYNGTGRNRIARILPGSCSSPATPAGNATQHFCSTSNPTVANLSATGTNILWYAASSGGSPLANLTPLANNTHYFATQSNGTCESVTRLDVTALVSNGPPATSAAQPVSPSDACAGDVQVITVPAVGGTNIRYSWNTGTNSSVVKFSTSISGPFVSGPFQTTTNMVYAQFGALAGSSGYNICVQGVNGCGSTNNRCIWVRGIVGVPGTITPAANSVACPNDIKSYSCGISGGAATYDWTLSGSAAYITSGQHTQNVQVTFPSTFTAGQLCVTAALACGGSSTSAPRCMTVSKNPAIPGGFLSGPSKVCPGATNVLYYVPSVAGATGYNWTVPPGATIIETPPYSTSIHVNFPNPYPNSPPVSAYATSACGISIPRSVSVSSALPVQPNSITGPTTNVCNSTVQYTVSATALASGYTWTLPAGATGITGQGTQNIQFNVPSNFTTGLVTVVANSSLCAPATSPAKSITINGAPPVPGTITANPSAWCSGAPVNFSVSAVSPLPQYSWTLTNGAITMGQNTTNIDVTWGTGTGNVSVRAINTCGASSAHVQSFASTCREENETEGESGSQQLAAYPNPAHGMLTVSIDVKESPGIRLQLTDITGRIVLSENESSIEGLNTYRLGLNHLSKGVYMLEAKTGSGSWKTKVVVE
ncbi:MAG: T9SS type A sorting domain-containing protein, partial [Bacteroidota bacterium]